MAAAEEAPAAVHAVALVAVSGREQSAQLHVRRDGLWLFTQDGRVSQQSHHTQCARRRRSTLLTPARC
jgi:hypothetical protein